MSLREYTTFYLDNQLFAVDILCVREINRALDITPVHHAPSFIRGLANLRGQVITIFDLSDKLGRGKLSLESNDGEDQARFNLVLKTNEELAPIRDRESRPELLTVNKDSVSFIVGQIGDVISADSDDIAEPPANHSDVDGKYLSGVIRCDDKLINLINVGKILDFETEDRLVVSEN